MRFSFFHRSFTVKWWHLLFWFFVACLVLFFVVFFKKTFFYYRAIRSGAVNPILERQLEATWSHLQANTEVTDEDLKRLVVSDAPSAGSTSATLTIVVFVDYGCPFSKQSAVPIRRMMDKYRDRVRFVIRDFPIDDLRPRSAYAAYAARCAQAQGAFWPFFDQLFRAQNRQEDIDFRRYVEEFNLDVTTFTSCYDNETPKEEVLQDMRDALTLGVIGTPTFFFNGVKVQGGMDEEVLDYLIKRFLENADKKSYE